MSIACLWQLNKIDSVILEVNAWCCMQVRPAAAAPDKSSLTLAASTVAAASQNVACSLSLSDTYGNLLTNAAHLQGSAILQLTVNQRTQATIRKAPALETYTFPLDPTAGAGISNGSSGGQLSTLRFEGSDSNTRLSWALTLTRAGIHELTVLLGAIKVATTPTNVTVTPGSASPAASRVFGTGSAGLLTTVAGSGVSLTLQVRAIHMHVFA